MRPVADLTRRRLPVSGCARPDGGHSRVRGVRGSPEDMFFAAQTARRLQEMSDFQLLVPQPYRHYSTGRCVTFEAPAEPVLLDSWRYREVSDALVRLALAEGIFLADLAPERFVADVSTGESGSPTPRRRLSSTPRGCGGWQRSWRRCGGDVDGIVRALPLAGSFVLATTPLSGASCARLWAFSADRCGASTRCGRLGTAGSKPFAEEARSCTSK